MRTLTAAAIGSLALLLAVDIPLDSPTPAIAAQHDSRIVNRPAPAYDGPVFEGRGWDLMNERGLRSLDTTQPIRVTFTTPEARTKVAPYLEPAAEQVADITGADIKVTDTIAPFDDEGCPQRGRIVVELTYRPLDKPGFSWAGNCHDTHTRAWHSGHIRVDTEWFEPGFYPSEAHAERVRSNGIAHELGHALGLDHPNTDLNGDGKTADHECPRNADGRLPLMCSPNNGQPGGTRAGRYTPMDAAGLRALVNNHTTGN